MPETTNSAVDAASSTPSTGPDLTATFTEAVQGLMNGQITDASSKLIVGILFPAAIALLMLIIAYFVARLLSRWVSAAVCKRVDQTLGRFLGKLTFYSVLTVAGICILQTANVNVTSFAAVLAAAGFAIGLAFQGTLSNFSSGILLLVFRPFKVGDFINAAGISGKVNEIDLFTTTLDTPDNRRLIVPNSSIAGTTIENVSFHKQRRVDIVVGVAYSADIEQTRQTLIAAVETLDEKIVRGEGRGYQILLSNLGASSVDWTLRVWVASGDFFAVKEQLTTTVKKQLDLRGIEIPFPQMQLHFPLGESREQTVEPKPAAETSRSGRIRPRVRGESTSL